MSQDENSDICFGELSRTDILRKLTEADVQLNVHAETLIQHSIFDGSMRGQLRPVILTVAELGLPDGGNLSEVLAAAMRQGLELVPIVAAPYLRLRMLRQDNSSNSVLSAGRAPADSIHIASQPLSDDVEYPKGFYLRVVDGQPWLRGYRCDDVYIFSADQRFLFASNLRL